jgi:hypothetical protein
MPQCTAVNQTKKKGKRCGNPVECDVRTGKPTKLCRLHRSVLHRKL